MTKKARNYLAFVSALLILSTLLTPPLLPIQAATLPLLIRLQYATFDPLAGEPGVPAGQRLTVQAGHPATYLLQFTGPVHDKWKAQVEAAGARLYGYVPDFAFIARMDEATAGEVQTLPFVRWVGPYHPAYRLASALQTSEVSQTSEVWTVTIQTLPDADLDRLAKQVEGWDGQVQGRAANKLAGYLRLSLPANHLPDVAALDEVLWVEPYFEPQLYNNVGGGTIMRANDVRTSLGLYGSGQTVAVADTGLDTGDESTLSADFEPQFVKAYALGRLNDWSDDNGHGTHVAGSVLGNGRLSGSNPGAHDYAGSFAGVAPEANLVFQSIMDAGGGLGGLPDNLVDLFTPPYNDGARIHTNSWGGPTGGTPQNPEYGGYTIYSRQADTMMWQHQDMLILFAAGNEGVDEDTDGVVDLDSIGSPGTAKNVVTVGASENLRPSIATTWGEGWPDDFPADPIFSDQIADDSAGMAAFSSRGPTDDGRVKPDIAAPGTFIISARSHDPNAGTGWGVYNEHYLYMGGTSMATPLTAGAAALVREWLTEQRGVSDPSAALMKAVLINGAADMSPGQYGTGGTQEVPNYRPNNVTGWGRVDLVESLNPPNPREIWFKDNTSGLSTGGMAVYTLTVGQVVNLSYSPPRASSSPHHPVTPTPTPIPTSVPALPRHSIAPAPFVAATGSSNIHPLGTSQLLQNPGFDTGAWTPWQPLGYPALTDQAYRSASYSAWLAGYDDADDYIYQSVTVPADATEVTLDFWYMVYSEESLAGYDYLCYDITDGDGSTLIAGSYCDDLYDTTQGQWLNTRHTLSGADLTPLLGRTVLVWFYAQTDAADSSSAWVDDTALNVTTGGGGSATLTITPESGPRGTPFHVTGSNFDPNDTVTIAIDGVDQFDVTSSGSGGFSFDLTPPGTETKGIHTITATDTGGHDASDTYEIVPQVSVNVSPSSGDPGDSFTVTGSGFHGGSIITVKLDDSTDGTTTANNDGGFTYDLDTDPGIANGTHTVSATDDENSTGNDTFTIGGGACPEALDDGGFEASTGDTSNPHWTVSDNAKFLNTPGGGHGGSDWVGLLGYTGDPATGDLWQEVSVPADASSATLSFWYQDWDDGAFALDVDVTDGGGATLVDLPDLTSSSGGWQQYSHTFTSGELTAIAGQATRLRFHIHDVSAVEDVAIDDVSWQICTGGTQTGGPFHITLAWTDYPGTPGAAKALVNDMDLEIIGPDGTHYYGNAGLYTSGQCLRDSKWDACNNVEGVIIDEALDGTYTVIVHGYNVPQGEGGKQPFALVASGDNLREGGSPPPERQISISPGWGPNGTEFTINGSNFTAGADVTLKVDGNTIDTVTANGSGSLNTTYTPTDLSEEQHTLTADDGDGQAQTTFRIIGELDNFVYLPLSLRNFGGNGPGADREVLFIHSEYGYNWDGDIWMMEADGGQPQVWQAGLQANYPSWSGDGNTLVFVKSSTEIALIDADGTNLRTAHELPGCQGGCCFEAQDPALSPDGTRIAHGVRYFCTAPYELFHVNVVDVNGANDTELAEGGSPDWSPDGTKIAYNCGGVYVMNADGSNQTLLTEEAWEPHWSPDGTRIAYVKDTGFYQVAIYVMNADGSNQTRLTEDINDMTYDLVWSPDGAYIYFDVEVEGEIDIYRVNVSTGQMEQLTQDNKSHAPAPRP